MKRRAEYIWLDGAEPTKQLRSKTRILEDKDYTLEQLPKWGYDGSSTYQAEGHDSDLELQPVCMVKDPIRGGHDLLVMCEVNNSDGTPHSTNTRSQLRSAVTQCPSNTGVWLGIEQEYTLFDGDRPVGWPQAGYPEPQGPYYCGVGESVVDGRELVEEHTQACLEAGLMLFGTNAEVMLGQWEYQIGYRGMEGDNPDPLTVSDHLWLARWLMNRMGEFQGLTVSLDNKPVDGDWNGAGAHTNFSTAAMRDPATGINAIEEAVARLGKRHDAHVEVYGDGLEERLTGLHETCDISEFRHGVADRGASVRIPRSVAQEGKGYLEDRRPGANCDPYEVSRMLVETIVLNKGA